jgi:hypothetical protein
MPATITRRNTAPDAPARMVPAAYAFGEGQHGVAGVGDGRGEGRVGGARRVAEPVVPHLAALVGVGHGAGFEGLHRVEGPGHRGGEGGAPVGGEVHV